MKHALLNRIAWGALVLALPLSALADVSGTKTLTANTNLNLDTGATATGAAGDFLWNGSTLTPQGNAKAFNLGLVGNLNDYPKSTLDMFKVVATSAPLNSATLLVGNIFAAFTNGGNTAGVIVTANSGGTLGLQFITYGAAGGGGGPTISNVLNNSSEIPAGFSNSGIAQGSLFKVLGSGLADAGDTSLHEVDPARGGAHRFHSP